MSRALIVDDNAQNLYLLQTILEGAGYNVISAKNGQEAFEIAEKESPDIIISDILMPVMDGFELCRRCKSGSTLKKIPFVFYTATYTDPKDEKFAMSLGADRFIIKPQSPEVIERSIREVLSEFKGKNFECDDKPLGEEAEVLRQYNEVLFSKLEKKVKQLQDEIALRTKAEDEIRALNIELENKVKERTASLEDAMLELETFSYSMSHDLKAPLRHINSFGKMLQNESERILNEKCIHYIDVIINSSDKMMKLIDAILFFARMKRSSIITSSVNMKILAEEVMTEVKPDLENRDIMVRILNLPGVTADRGMMKVVLWNLVSNAVKFTSKRDSAIIEIGCEHEGKRLIFYVKDNGAGFDQDRADRLFNMFERLHNEKDFEGTGIGLATVRQIIKKHGGETWAEGKPGEGACFYFSIPGEMFNAEQ